RCGAGAFRTNLEQAERVNSCNAPAARADFEQVDCWHPQRQATAFFEAMDAGHLEGARELRLRLVDQTQLGRGAAHVECHYRRPVALTREMRRRDSARGRTGFNHTDGILSGSLYRGDSPIREHQEERHVKPSAQLTQVAI